MEDRTSGWAGAGLCWRKGLSEVGVSWQKEPALGEGLPCCFAFSPPSSGSPRPGPSQSLGARGRARSQGVGKAVVSGAGGWAAKAGQDSEVCGLPKSFCKGPENW